MYREGSGCNAGKIDETEQGQNRKGTARASCR